MKIDYKLPVFNFDGSTVGEVTLKWEIFSQPIRKDILHRVVVWQQAKARRGTHSQKTRAEKRGSNAKLRPQKGQGKARVGTRRAPHRRGGGRAFPKKPRNYFYPLPKAVRLLGLKIALSAKLAQGKLFVVDNLSLNSHKTKGFKEILDKTGWKSALLVDAEKVDRNLQLASQPYFYSMHLLPAKGLNVYSILHKDVLVLSKSSIEVINRRLISPPKFKLYDNSHILSKIPNLNAPSST